MMNGEHLSALTDERIDNLANKHFTHGNHLTPHQWRSFARSILTEPSAQVQGETPAPLRGEKAVRSALRAYVQLDESRGNLKDKLYVQAVAALAAPMPQSAGVTDALRELLEAMTAKFPADSMQAQDAWSARRSNAIDAARSILAIAPGLSGWQEIASDADRIAAWLLTQVQGGYSLMNRLYNEPPNVADSVAAGAWIQTVTQHLHCLAANAAPQAPGIAPHQPQPDYWRDAVENAYTRADYGPLPADPFRAVDGLLEKQVSDIRAEYQPQPEPQEAAEQVVKMTQEQFIEWFGKNYYGEVVFGDPEWHAKSIYRRLVREATNTHKEQK